MAASPLADSSFLVALLSERDANHDWAAVQAMHYPPPWRTCEAVLSEAFYMLGTAGTAALAELLQTRTIICDFDLAGHVDEVLKLMKKYGSVPMSLADACLVRMSEILPDPTVITTDSDFDVYRRHGRQVVPRVTPR